MKGAAQRWIVASVAGLSLVIAAGAAAAVEVTDNDRTFRNFTRETATVSDGEVRLEVRGMALQDEENTRLNTFGVLQQQTRVCKVSGAACKSEADCGTSGPCVRLVQSVDGGVIDLLGSYGLGKNAELGFDIPGYIESKRLGDGRRINNKDVGDILLYTKFKYSVAQHCQAGGGVELSLPNGPAKKGFSTGELGINPYISSRYQRGRFALGANVGYQINTGDRRHVVDANDLQAKDVFNYGIEAIVRGSETYALRAEIAGRVFNQNGQRWHDAVLLPGIDINLSDTLTIRPTGLANLTKTAIDWGVGIGVATRFVAPSLPQAPPPPPPPPAPQAAVAAPPPPTKEKIVLRGVNFDLDKAIIRVDAQPVLDQAAETLQQNSAITIIIEGHTDSTGSAGYNQRLSVRRANTVRDYLSAHGIAASRMTVEGRGASQPVATNDTVEGRAQNRRVELRITE